MQKWIDADQALETAHENHVQTKQEMAQLLAEQTAENAKSVDQEKPGVQAQTTAKLFSAQNERI